MSELVAYVDGGSHGNPGPSGIGVVIQDSTGGKFSIAKWIGHHDNNVAEYVALLEALQVALTMNAKALRVYSDSEVVVRTDEWRLYLSKSPSLFAELDLPQTGEVTGLLNHANPAGGQSRGQSSGQSCRQDTGTEDVP